MRGENNFSSAKLFGILFILALTLFLSASTVSATCIPGSSLMNKMQDYNGICSPNNGECNTFNSESNCPAGCSWITAGTLAANCRAASDANCYSIYGCIIPPTTTITTPTSPCDPDELEVYDSCSGEYIVGRRGCVGEYQNCPNKAISCDEFDYPVTNCSGKYRGPCLNINKCSWEIVENISHQCSSRSESVCGTPTGCKKETKCIKKCTDTDTANDIRIKGTTTTSQMRKFGNSLNLYLHTKYFYDNCIDSTTLRQYFCDSNTQSSTTTTCNGGCNADGGICNADCPSDTTWDSSTETCKLNAITDLGVCKPCKVGQCEDPLTCQLIRNSETERVCVNPNKCAQDTSASCEVPAKTTVCNEKHLFTCQESTSKWSTPAAECPTNACLDKTTCRVVPLVEWTNILEKPSVSVTLWEEKLNPPTITMIVRNANPLSGNFKLYEVDGATRTPIASNIESKVSKVLGTDLVHFWQPTLAQLTASGEETDDIFEFQFSWNGINSTILKLTKEFKELCPNKHCDIGEDFSTCFADCFKPKDGFCDNGQNGRSDKKETCENSPQDCAAFCTGVSWTQADSPYNALSLIQKLTAKEFVDGAFRLYLANPTASPGKFEIIERDFIDNDEIKERNGVSETNGGYSYTWNGTISNLITALDEDDDQVFEFFFKVDGHKSKTLIVNITTPIPVCSKTVCGGLCPKCIIDPCLKIKQCKDYGSNLAACTADKTTCNVAAKQLGTPAPGETISCYYENNKCDVERKTDRGSCRYTATDENEDPETVCETEEFFTTAYNGTYIWSPNNNYSDLALAADSDYVYDKRDSRYHFDPNGEYFKCGPVEKTFECVAQIQLSFFTWMNLVASIVLIILAYMIIINRKNKTAKKNKKKTTLKKVTKKVAKKSTKKITKKKTTSKKKK